jgi:hypothetical protein
MSWGSVRTALAAALLAGLGGCGDHSPVAALDPTALSAGEASRLVLDFDRHHCYDTKLYDDHRNGSYMTIPGGLPNETDTALAWLKAVANRDQFRELNVEHQGNCISAAELKSPVDGWSFLLRGCVRAPTDGNSALFGGCVAVPTSVKVLDVSRDADSPKRATVVYTSTLDLTSVGKLVAEPGSANESGVRLLDLQNANHQALDLLQGKEYRATLERLDATGWRVDKTTFFHPEVGGP